MQITKLRVPTHLPLADIILDPALQVRPVSEEIAEDYAEHVESLPPVIVWDVDDRYLLADGWHRRRAHELAGKTEIRVQILKGTMERAKLFVANCDARVGIRRNRAAKRAAVMLVLGTAVAADWSDRKIGAHCGVSHTFVGLLRARLAAGTGEEDDAASGNVATAQAGDSADGGNVATRAASARPRSPKVGNVATASKPGSGPTAAKVTAPDNEAYGEDEEIADTDGVANSGEPTPSFETAEVPTVNDVVNCAEAILVACDDDDQRREALGQLIEAFTGMLGALEEVEEPLEDDLPDAAP